MNPNATAAVLLVVAALVVAPLAAASSPGGPAAPNPAQDTGTAAGNSSVTPGEKLSGAVGVQQAELEGEVDERTFGVKVAQSNSNASKADVVAGQLADVEQRIAELEQRKQTLTEARANGSMSEGEYRAKMARVAAEIGTAERLANTSASTAAGLPEDVLAEKGIDVTAIRTLAGQARNLSGPEVAKIAQSIAGEDVGTSMAGDRRPSDVGPRLPRGAQNGTDTGQQGDGGVPNATDGGASNGTDGGASNGSDGGAPNGTDGAPNGTDGQGGADDDS